MNLSNPLISANELKAGLAVPDQHVVVLDATMHLPNAKRDAWQEYQQGHIPGAAFFDIDKIADSGSDLPHMLPSASEFSEAVARLGVGADAQVVVYDTVGMFSAARVWWMFNVFGHNKVRVLDGGLPAWQAEGFDLQTGEADITAADRPIKAQQNQNSVASLQTVRDAVESGIHKILDARSKARFDGAAPEPREGLRLGHMPGAYSMPFTELLTASDDNIIRMKSAEQLKVIFENCGVQRSDSVITSCGSGVTAAVVTLGLHMAGFNTGCLYDGSWVEWGSRSDTPITT